ncbi:carbohydrate porin [Wenyingzhuangia aestuarii]|uniref:carbohydrate porin n=1 Tax=Wenyingzhuangia aestuarii TaxID=1647582 RepID=UPI00143C0C16|nr:carbohydrate porin [Wenyingzhuangia aestuarii]NJB82713.1 maltoporin [Wenyingzhuangia aestuarii]
MNIFFNLLQKDYGLNKRIIVIGFINARISSCLTCVLLLWMSSEVHSQTIFKNENNTFGTSGYIRTGVGRSEGAKTQAHFQMPGAQNKYSLGNQADTYGELEFDYVHYLNTEKNKSLDVVWMTSFYEAFGSENQMEFDKTAQLYIRGKNLLGKGETLWVGKRYYDRKAIHLLDRQWINPAQKGWGFGVEDLLKNKTNEDLKIGVWSFKDDDVVSYINRNTSKLKTFTLDTRWVNMPVSSTLKLNLALNYSYRPKNETLAYQNRQGFGAFAWLDYEKNKITNTIAVLFRQGATVPQHHWTGMSEKENPDNSTTVFNNLKTAYTLEINNNFLYDDLDKFAINGILLTVIRDYGTHPYVYRGTNNLEFQQGKGNMMYWLTAGARGMYYMSDYFKLSLEISHEYIHNEQLDVTGNLNRISFTPEISLSKGFYSRPVLRPLVTYAFWSDDLKGKVGNIPNDAPFGNATDGFTYGLQFEIWW